MSRVSVAVSATIISALVCGCGPRDAAQTVQGGTPVTLEVKRGTGVRQTWSRKEIREWVTEGNKVSKTPADFKARFGPPARTREDARGVWLYYEYDGLSVDADGSGRVDAMTVFKFHAKPVSGEDQVAQSQIEFIP